MKIIYFFFSFCLFTLVSCSESIDNSELINSYPPIYPDYIGVTIPKTIAPLHFDYAEDSHDKMDIRITSQGKELYSQQGKQFSISPTEWRKLLNETDTDSLIFNVSIKTNGFWKRYKPFAVYISTDSIDHGLVYRKIAPGYEVYSKMGIYQRNLSSFEEDALIENTLVKGMCVNCHSFNQTDPKYMSLHVRGDHGATFLKTPENISYLNTKTDETISSCVYPYWHPSGEFIAYSTNNTRQSFHSAKDKRIEVIDLESDVVVYHPKTNKLLHCDLLETKDCYETYPAFSADGKVLYFCQATAREIPAGYKDIRYNLCSIAFDPETQTFGSKIDTLILADSLMKSIVFPRPSYDGKYIMFTLCDYGNFPIWHKEADLGLIDLSTNKLKILSEVNSSDTESFHSWSSNSHWFVFSSRREDGLHTRLYLAHIDKDGNIGKPFMLPQKDPKESGSNDFYSYNVPEFVNERIELNKRSFEKNIISDQRKQIKSK